MERFWKAKRMKAERDSLKKEFRASFKDFNLPDSLLQLALRGRPGKAAAAEIFANWTQRVSPGKVAVMRTVRLPPTRAYIRTLYDDLDANEAFLSRNFKEEKVKKETSL